MQTRPTCLKWSTAVLTRTSLYGLRTPASCVLYVAKRLRAACPRGPTHYQYTCVVRVPASGVPYLPRTVASQVDQSHTGTILRSEALAACATWKNELALGNAPSQQTSVCTIL